MREGEEIETMRVKRIKKEIIRFKSVSLQSNVALSKFLSNNKELATFDK